MMRPQTDKEGIVGSCSEVIVGFALGLIACLLISLCGCKGKELVTERVEVPVVVTQEHHTEQVRVDIVRDTIRQRDSVFYFVKGDTTIIERWHYYTDKGQSVRVDTFLRVDSVPVPVITERVVTKVEQVQKPLNWLQKTFIGLGGLSLVLCGLWLAFKLGKRKI